MEISIYHIWLLAGGVLIGIEVLVVPGVGFIFAGLSCISVGVALMSGVISSHTAQVTWFFGATALWAGILWKPLRRFHFGHGSGYSDMIGSNVVVENGGLEKGRLGQVRWSGTVMNSRLAPDCDVEKIDSGMEVVVVNIVGGVLIVSPKTTD